MGRHNRRLNLEYVTMTKKSRLCEIVVDEARGFLLDVFDPLIRLARWIRRRDRK